MHAVVRPRSAMLALALLVACAPGVESPAEGECRVAIWGRAERPGERLSVTGTWDAWATALPMRDFPDGWQVLELDLPPGEHGYLVVEESRGRIDRHQPLTTFREDDEQEVSLLLVDDCAAPGVRIARTRQTGAGAYEIEVSVQPSRSGAPFDASGVLVRDESGPLAVVDLDVEAGTIRLLADGRAPGKHHATVTVTDREGMPSPARPAVAWIDPVAATWADGVLYQVMIDRFRGDAGAVLDPPATPGSRAGGTLDGVRAELEAGTFEALGVSALWLSPVYENPVDAREGRDDDRLYEGYHGYWPLHSRVVEPRIGGAEALHDLVATAHARGIRVILDLVPNHFYEANPRVAEHRGDGWFHAHDPPCVCGAPTCPWSMFIQTCWFTDYLPDLRFENADVMDTAIDDARWWQDTFDIDGVRIDAVPMMPRAVTRRLVHALRKGSGTADTAFTLGEIFTGGGESGTADIRFYMGPDGLDSAFDFPLMWALRDAIAHERAGFSALEDVLQGTDVALAGSGAVMARMIGNHDVTRFASEIAGDAGSDPWDAAPPQPGAEAVYQRQALALGLVLTLPGLPVIYYGDEVGLAGAADPDNRRVMPDLAGLPAAQAELLHTVRRIATARRCLPALRTGTRVPLVAGDDTWAFARDGSDGRAAIVVASRAEGEVAIALPAIATVAPGAWVDVLTGDRVALSAAGGEVRVDGPGLRVLLPEGDACAG
jgi:glycosidase